MKCAKPMIATLILFFGSAGQSSAAIIAVGTQNNPPGINNLDWLITGAGATQTPAFSYGGTQISITNTATQTGTFVTGGSLANFNGFWFADRKFFLPSNATSVSLIFSGLVIDDRGVLELNGNIIGNFGISGPGSTQIAFPPGPPDVPFTFTNTTAGTVTSGFVLGGDNTLRLIVNNTNTGISGNTRNFVALGDGTAAGFDAIVSFSVTNEPATVPEPSTFILAALGLLGIGFVALRKKYRRDSGPVA